MAARHAGFGAVVTATEKVVNDTIASYTFGRLGPYFIPLPPTVTVGPVDVSLSGVLQLLTPTVELHPNAADLVRVHLVLVSTLRAQLPGQPAIKWRVRFTTDVDVPPRAVVDSQTHQITIGIDTPQVVVQPLSAQVLQGPALPAKVLKALQSPQLAATVTAYIQGLPPWTITPPLLRDQFSYTQPLELPFIIDPSWFTVGLTVSRIVVKPLEGALTIAVDFQGLTSGHEAGLVDLTSVRGKGSLYTNTVVPGAEQVVLVRHQESRGGSISAVVNIAVISSMISHQISPQVSGTLISANPDVSLTSVSAAYSGFYKELRGPEDGLALNFTVYVQEGPWFHVDGTLYLQVYHQDANGYPTEYLQLIPQGWSIYAGRVDLDLPWWVDFVSIFAPIYIGVAMPMFAPLMAVSLIALTAGVIPGLIESAESQVRNQLNKQSPGFPDQWSIPLPGLTTPEWAGAIKNISFTPEGVDVAVNTMPMTDPDSLPLATIAPATWPAGDRSPIRLSVKVRDDLARFADELMVSWTVRRADTNAVVASGHRKYTHPSGNGVHIDHHSSELYYVDAYHVRCRIRLSRGGQTGEIWSGVQTVAITDILDRRRRYVQWGPHSVFFKNEGTGGSWWTRTRTSRIHRTAVSARCLMLRQAAQAHSLTGPDAGQYFTGVTYLDTLPVPANDLYAHRGPLCEYCFFGGPDKTTPYPDEDWF